MYKLIDDAGLFNDEGFKTKQDVVNALIDFHNEDFSGVDDDDNEFENGIEEMFEYRNINTVQKQLNWLLEHGQWELKKV